MKKRLYGGAVVGIDLSLSGTSACALPCPWDFDLGKIRHVRAGRKLTKEATPAEKLDRQEEIADALLAFCREVQARHVFIEDHAYGRQSTANASQIVECHGIVKYVLRENWGVVVTPIPIMRGRKVLLQSLPKKDSKTFTEFNVKRLGGVTALWDGDSVDAFVCANTGLMLVGATAMTFFGTWPEPIAKKRRKKRDV